MNLLEIPPKNSLFSRQWRWHYDSLDNRDKAKSEWLIYEKVVHGKIDFTNRKLENLEQQLQKIQRIGEIEGEWIDYATVLSTIGFLKKHIGVWRISTSYEDICANMTYPNKLHMANWNDDVLGRSKSGDICVVMLSDAAVKWLNWLRILNKPVDTSYYTTFNF